MTLGSLIAFGGYLVFYSNNAAVQPWYTGTMLVPAFLIIFFLAKNINATLGPRAIPRALLMLAVVALIAFNLNDTAFVDTNHAPWVWQQDLYQAGQALAKMKLERRVGAWNAGILGYFQGGTLVNLDGLVNNDIYAYAVRNALPEYIAQKNIGYVIDYENLFHAPYMQKRGGYQDAAFLQRLEPLQIFDDGSRGMVV
jgi:hypothetical protein